MTLRIAVVAAGILGAVSCATNGSPTMATVDAEGANGMEAGYAGGSEFSISELTDSALPKGECGMILWTLEMDRPAAVFRYIASKRAEIAIDGNVIGLSLTGASGQASYGVSEHLEFSDGGGLKVTVQANFGMGFDGGSYLEQTLLSVENADGWKSVIPSAGVAGCRPK